MSYVLDYFRVMQSMVFLYVPGIGLLQSRKHPDTAMFQVHSTTIQPCFRYTALPFSHVSGTQHYHSVMFQVYTALHSTFYHLHINPSCCGGIGPIGPTF